MIFHEQTRSRVVDVARSWLGTPYHENAEVKGAGCDCATYIAAVYKEAGMLTDFVMPSYRPTFHLHSDDPVYVRNIVTWCAEIERKDLLPGDIVVFRFGRQFAHGAIVTRWPSVIHSYIGRGVIEDDVEQAKWLSIVGENDVVLQGCRRPMRSFRPKVWLDVSR
jgi:NlpC/P60 family putative phage cell wall peptidase